MNTKIKELSDKLSEKCCSLCTHLSLQDPDEKFRYKIKCIILNDIPISANECEYFELEYYARHKNI